MELYYSAPNSQLIGNQKEAYNKLVNQIYDKDDVTLYIYRPNNETYQNLLPIEFSSPHIITMYDNKIAGE